MPLIAAMLAAEAERRRQEGRAHPAYRDRWLGWRHLRLESYARRLLREAPDGRWLRFYAADADGAAMTDQILRYIVRQERPAQSVRIEWLRRDGTWADRFPRRPLDSSRLTGRGSFPRGELARMAREQSADGEWWYAGRLRLGPKRGTVAPPALPRARRSAADVLGDALGG
jgi:hypothetical protein